MIAELITYLLKQATSMEIEGLKMKGGSMWKEFFEHLHEERDRFVQPVMEEFFTRMREERMLAMKQFAKLTMILSGGLLFIVGIGFALDDILNIKGAGFAIVGAVAVLASFLIKDR